MRDCAVLTCKQTSTCLEYLILCDTLPVQLNSSIFIIPFNSHQVFDISKLSGCAWLIIFDTVSLLFKHKQAYYFDSFPWTIIGCQSCKDKSPHSRIDYIHSNVVALCAFDRWKTNKTVQTSIPTVNWKSVWQAVLFLSLFQPQSVFYALVIFSYWLFYSLKLYNKNLYTGFIYLWFHRCPLTQVWPSKISLYYL